MQIFDDILEILKDGKGYSYKEIASKVKLNDIQLEFALAFLEKYNFINRYRWPWSDKTRRAQLTPVMVGFLKRIKELEGLGTS
jgi:hypothetical protein